MNGNQIGIQLLQGAQVVNLTYRPSIFLLSIGLLTKGGLFGTSVGAADLSKEVELMATKKLICNQ